MWTLIPLPYRILAIVAVLAAIFGVGYHSGLTHERDVKDAEIAKLNEAFNARVATAEAAKEAAEAKATETGHQTAIALNDADTKHTQELSDANAKTAAAVAAYRAGTERLRYNVSAADPGRRGPVSGPATPASGGDAGTTAELPPAIAGALLELAGDADSAVIELHLAQDTIRAYYAACGPQTPSP